MPFKFPLNTEVTITTSGEAGKVIGRAEYTNSANAYMVRYRSADGGAVEAWWQEDALASADVDQAAGG